MVYSFPAVNGSEVVGTASFYKGIDGKYAVGEIYCKKKFIYLFVIKDFASEYLIIAGKNYQGNITSIEITKKDSSSYNNLNFRSSN